MQTSRESFKRCFIQNKSVVYLHICVIQMLFETRDLPLLSVKSVENKYIKVSTFYTRRDATYRLLKPNLEYVSKVGCIFHLNVVYKLKISQKNAWTQPQ